MRTHYLDTRCRVKSFIVKEHERPLGWGLRVPYRFRNGVMEFDTYVVQSALRAPDGKITHLKYGRLAERQAQQEKA